VRHRHGPFWFGGCGTFRQVMVRCIAVCFGGLGWVRRCVLGFDGLSFGHGTAVKSGFVQAGCDEVSLGLAVLIRCVRVRFGRVRTRYGGRVSVLLVLVWLNKSRRSRSDMSGLGEDWSDRVSRGAVS